MYYIGHLNWLNEHGKELNSSKWDFRHQYVYVIFTFVFCSIIALRIWNFYEQYFKLSTVIHSLSSTHPGCQVVGCEDYKKLLTIYL